MSRLVSRILLSIFVFPLASLFYVVVFEFTFRALRIRIGYSNGEFASFFASDIATWFFIAVYWFLLWKSGIKWNGRRIYRSYLAAAAAATFGLAAGVLAAQISQMGPDWGFGTFVGGVLAILLWLIATVFIWRESANERTRRISQSNRSAITCPTCGYNLTGLTESRCPECGSKFTLDELLALQPHADAEVE
ncbi:MAG: zinc ribbon domain-containing protein [Tepidisphaeraceae bacterium]|jgi:DNA-directed RNA polymerase subunit RPC12/RpoP